MQSTDAEFIVVIFLMRSFDKLQPIRVKSRRACPARPAAVPGMLQAALAVSPAMFQKDEADTTTFRPGMIVNVIGHGRAQIVSKEGDRWRCVAILAVPLLPRLLPLSERIILGLLVTAGLFMMRTTHRMQ